MVNKMSQYQNMSKRTNKKKSLLDTVYDVRYNHEKTAGRKHNVKNKKKGRKGKKECYKINNNNENLL